MHARHFTFTIILFFAAAPILNGQILTNICRAESGDVTFRKIAVSGSGVHFFTTAIVHSTESTATGMIQRSTDTVELSGDLTGRLLYHPVSEFDFAGGTLVNTGHQVFSGTVLGSDPVLLHDDTFRFEVNLATGETVGAVHLTDRLAGPNIRCDLSVVGTGMTAEGDATFDYEGVCKVRTPAQPDRGAFD